MKPSNMTVFELFERQQRYVVPLFQRPYIWTKENQWGPLWQDISLKAEEILYNRQTNHREPSNHFLGAIVLNPIKTSGLQVTARSIVDGQQRLTTLQIILYALRDFMLAEKIDRSLLETIELHTFNKCKMDQPIEKYKVWPTFADQKVFEAIFSAGSPEELHRLFPPIRPTPHSNPLPLPRLVEAYLFFYDSIRAFVNVDNNEDGIFTEEDQKERVEALVEAFKRHLEIVTIDLDENDNPQMIFETLNFRGVPLLPSDLIRNFVFLEATRSGLNVEGLYNKYWAIYDVPGSKNERNFWKEEEQQGRIKRQRMELFVFHYLVCRSENTVSITELYKNFRDWWNLRKPSVEDELIDLQNHSQIFREFYQHDKSSRKGVFLRRIRLLDISTIYPLLLYLFSQSQQDLPLNELQGIMVDLESFIFRRLVCGLTTKNYNNFFLNILISLHREGKPTQTALRSLLLASTLETGRWPDDKEFEGAWLTRDVYRGLGHRAKIVLEAIDLQLQTNKQEEVHLTGGLTLEHLMPLGFKEVNYPYPAAENEEERVHNRERRAMLMQTFGNLTLLTQALNSSISNGAFDAKLEEIHCHSLLRLNSELLKPHKAGCWTEEDIHARGEKLFKIARQIWPHP